MNLESYRAVFDMLSPRQRLRACELLGLLFLGALFEMFSVAMVLPVLAVIASPDASLGSSRLQAILDELGNPDRPTIVVALMAGIAGVYLLKSCFLVYSQWRQARFVWDVDVDIAIRLFERYLGQPWDFHTQRNSAELIRNATQEATEFRLAVTSQVTLLAECLTILMLASAMAIASPLAFAVIGGMFAAVGVAFQALTRKRIRRWGEIRSTEYGERNRVLMEGLGSAKEVILYGREAFFVERLRRSIERLARISRRYLVAIALPRLTLEFVAVTTLAVAVAVMLSIGQPLESVVPVVGMFAVASTRLLPSINRVVTSLQQINYAAPAIATLRRECQLSAGSATPPAVGAAHLARSIRFEDVAYAYPGTDRPAISGLSLEIPAGSTVAFIGTSGAGKSTVVDLMLGLLRPTAGTIRVDGEDVQHHLRRWRSQIGYVPQLICLTDDSVRANVAFGIPPEQVDEAAIGRALQAAQLDDFVRSLPEGLDTRVGEKGVRLSGGQRQRIGIARALYGNPAVLVLDEATSALDEDTESQVMSAIYSLKGTRTIVIVTHRMSTIASVDRIFRLERGKLLDERSTET